VGTIVIRVAPGPAPGELIVRDGDRVEQVFAVTSGDTTWVFHDGRVYEIASESGDTRRRGARARGSLTAPMPATVIEIKVAAGDAVTKGDILVVLEAMKMELPVRAPGDGRVKAVHCRPGDLVQPETSLIDLAPREPRGDAEPGRGIE
jgi:acetyl/propionyl-CoA carboxylase alpha subunit